MAKPSPVSKFVVCSVCDLPWEDHTKGRKTAPDLSVCVRLLRGVILKWRRPVYMGATTTATQGNLTTISQLREAN